jgi:signal transduction histidine kinase/CHASE2 domain-containing sensor protein
MSAIPHPVPRQLRQSVQAGLIVGLLTASWVLLLWQANWFVGLRLRLANFYYVPLETSGTVTLVAIDDASIQRYGAYPDWTRERYAALVDILADAGARVIVFDLLFAEPRSGDDALADAITRAREQGVRTVLPATGIPGSQMHQPTAQVYVDELSPVAAIADAALYTAYVNTYPDADGMIRHYPAQGVLMPDSTQRYSLAVAAYLAYFNVSPTLAPQVVTLDDHHLTLPPGVVLPLDTGGLWMFNYFGPVSMPTHGTFDVTSIYKVLEGKTAPAQFADKIVMVGLMDATGAVDTYQTPANTSGELMSGVEVQANVIETLLANVPLRYENRLSQIVTITLLALLTSLLYAQVRWYSMIVLAVGFFLLWFIYASVNFSLRRVVMNPLHPNLTIFLALLFSVGAQISREIRQRQRLESLLQTLVQVSQQQLALDRILLLVASDLRTMTNAPTGAVYLPLKGTLETVKAWGDGDLSAISLAATQAQVTQFERDLLAVPVVWQRRVMAVMAVQLPRFYRWRGATHRQVERFSERIAASLENARLFAEIQNQYLLLQGILAESPAGILVLDHTLNILHANEQALTWLGFAAPNFAGQPLSAMLEGSRIDEDAWQQIGANLMAQKPFRMELKVNGSTYQLDAAHIPGGKRWVITLSDITELAELSQIKTRMIRMASHDLKNPLGRVSGYGELMRDMLKDEGDAISPRYLTMLKRMLDASDEMLLIITEILSLEHIRVGRIEREPLSLTNIVRNVIERHMPDAENKQQTLTIAIDDDLPAVRGDFNQLVQAVSNLVGNAIKYTPDGGKIDMRLCQHNGTLRLEVADNGYGMPEDALDNLFTEFYRVRTEKTQNIKGTGLGLSLVKSVIEAHEGKIWVESKLDVGSTFYVELPAALPV